MDIAGDTLAQNADVDFTFGDKPPYVGFAGQGVILPREDADDRLEQLAERYLRGPVRRRST